MFCLISSTTHEAMSYSTIEDKERFELFVVSKINPQYTEEDLHAVVAFCHFLSLPAVSSHPEVLDLASTGVNPLHTVSSNWPLSVLEVVFKPIMVFSCVQLKAAERGWTKIESELYFLLSCQSIERWKFCICDLSRRNIVHNFTCQQKFPEAAMPAWTRKKCHSTFTNGFQPERPLTSWKVYVLEMFYTKQLQNQYCETVVSFYVLLT